MEGTTILGMVCDNGIILASEHRVTMDTSIVHKNLKKIYMLDKHIGTAFSGQVGDSQYLLRQFRAKINLYQLENKNRISIEGASYLLSNLLRGENSPYYVQVIVGGWYKEMGEVHSIDAAGGVIKDEYVVAGSGSQYAYGVLEDKYRTNLSVDDGIDIALSALNAAIERDSSSGDEIDVAVIDQQGFKFLAENVIKNRLQILRGSHG